MNILEEFKNRNNLKFMEIGNNNKWIIWLLENILITDSCKLFYINNFIENDNINLLKYNDFLTDTKNYSNKIILIKEKDNIALKNPFITIQQFDYIHIYQTNDNRKILENIILSFNILKTNGIIHITVTDYNQFNPILDCIEYCYSDKYNILKTDKDIFISLNS